MWLHPTVPPRSSPPVPPRPSSALPSSTERPHLRSTAGSVIFSGWSACDGRTPTRAPPPLSADHMRSGGDTPTFGQAPTSRPTRGDRAHLSLAYRHTASTADSVVFGHGMGSVPSPRHAPGRDEPDAGAADGARPAGGRPTNELMRFETAPRRPVGSANLDSTAGCVIFGVDAGSGGAALADRISAAEADGVPAAGKGYRFGKDRDPFTFTAAARANGAHSPARPSSAQVVRDGSLPADVSPGVADVWTPAAGGGARGDSAGPDGEQSLSCGRSVPVFLRDRYWHHP